MERYEINHDGLIVSHKSALCSDLDKMLTSLFNQYGWTSEIVDKNGSCRRILLKDANEKSKSINVYCGTIRNEARNPYEKKIQLGTVTDPKKKSKEDTLIIGVYVFEENDGISDAVFVGYPIDDKVRYDANPSIRGTFVNQLLIDAKNNGFIYDKEHNTVGFLAPFIYYYLDNHCNLHYSSGKYPEVSYEDEPDACQVESTEDIMSEKAKQVCTFDSEKSVEYVNLIVYGTPGCGKSYYVKDELLKDYKQENIIRTTFYQDYTNTDFVGQILPTVSGDDVTYEFNPGPFTLALERAISNPQEPVALVIEELNRGNAPSIFGDIFQLLDRENGKSEYQITNVNVQKYLSDKIEDSLFEYIMIPSNLSIVATMNTSDQNVFTLDTAFKRRWDYKKLKNKFTQDHPYKDYYVPSMSDTTWETFVNSINTYIVSAGSDLQSEDKQLGVFFVDKTLLLKDSTDSSDKKAEKFAYKVLEYLWDDVAKFDRDAWFNEKIKSLDELVEEFVASGKEVFKDGIFKQHNS